MHSEFVRQWRRVVTGDPNKRIRDSLDESKAKTRVKQVDSLSFTFGVLVTYLVQWIALMRPDLLKHFYYLSMLVLLPHRFFTYRAEKAHFYMIDFCYFVNLSAILQTLFCGCEGSFCGNWFQMNYILTQGPIATAIVLWGNSLVFHSLDKHFYIICWDGKLGYWELLNKRRVMNTHLNWHSPPPFFSQLHFGCFGSLATYIFNLLTLTSTQTLLFRNDIW